MNEYGYGVNGYLPTMQQVVGQYPACLSKWSQSRISYECPALELLMSNAIIFDVAAPALPFLSLFFLAETVSPTVVPVTIVGDRSNATSGCVVFSLLHANTNSPQGHKIQKCWGQNLTLLFCRQDIFVLFFGVCIRNILLSKPPQ